jgi:hypothetical protein
MRGRREAVEELLSGTISLALGEGVPARTVRELVDSLLAREEA